MTYIQALQDTVQRTHRCKALRIMSEPVREVFQGQTQWEGVVQVFHIEGHPKTNVCYAWGHHVDQDSDQCRYVTVLRIPPVISPRDAVRTTIAADSKTSYSIPSESAAL